MTRYLQMVQDNRFRHKYNGNSTTGLWVKQPRLQNACTVD